jgi:glyoxylase-like metal-dependent hydrolase (beta-lactamase superfamily II)
MATVDVATYLSPYKQIPATVPGWDDDRQATWPASTATLLSCGGSAVLVDALMTLAEGEHLAEWIGATGLELTTVYVTHAHADHFFGATSLLRKMPTARLVSLPEIARSAAEQTAAGYLRVWSGFFPGQIAEHPLVPAPWDGHELAVGAGSVRVVPVGWSDVEVSSVVHVGDRETVVAGDVAYNGMHMWLAGSTPQSRAGWIASLDAVEKLGPRVVIAGHRDPQAPDDDSARILDESRRYVQDFGDAVGSSSGPEELIATMLARHGTLGNPYTLWVAAHSQFDS